MTIVSYGPGLASYGYADTAWDAMNQSLTKLPNIVFTYETPTEVIGDYRLLNLPNLQTVFYGYGFTFNSYGAVTGGIITGLQTNFNGLLVSKMTGTSVAVTTLEGWVLRDDYVTADATVFSGNDTFYAPTGYSAFNGYSGIDTVVLPDAIKQDTISGYAPNQATISSTDISDSLTSIERIQFVDGTLYYDTGSPAAQIVRMYESALGRAPDALGLASWVSALNNGTTLTQVASGFISSAEFQSRFPGVSENATAFVTQLYANVLHRAPDPAGLASWVGALQSGTQTQAQVLVGFSESAENQSDTAGSLANGVWVADEQAASVARLYYSALDRAPDAGGLIAWTKALESGTDSLLQEATGFMASPEFQAKYGNLSNNDFVTLLYHNVLGRQPDSGGFTAWTGVLNTGTESRAQVLTGFSESLENKIILEPRIEASGILLA